MRMKTHWPKSYLLFSKAEISRTLKISLLYSAILPVILNLEKWSNAFIAAFSKMKMWSSSSAPNLVYCLIIKQNFIEFV